MKLYSYFRSSAAYRVRIALNLKSVPYELEPVNLLKGEHHGEDYGVKNSQGLVPSLELNDGRILTQSGAILDWLEDEYPEPALYPSDRFGKAEVKSACQIISCDIHPLDNLRVLTYLTEKLGVGAEDKTTWYHHWIQLGFASLESKVKAMPYAMGNTISMLDIYLIPQVYNALRFNVDMTDFQNIMSVYQSCNELEAFSRASPEAQADSR